MNYNLLSTLTDVYGNIPIIQISENNMSRITHRSLYFNTINNGFTLKAPDWFFNTNDIDHAIDKNRDIINIEYNISNGSILLDGYSPNDFHTSLIKFFADIHNHPYYNDVDTQAFRNHSDPVLSCIILLTFNDDFVLNHLIPSLIKNSAGHNIEIIVVHNGPSCQDSKFDNFTLVKSDLCHAARGYNSGIKAARGEYIALFHDDCILDDPQWVDKAFSLLNENCKAITSEFDKETAKFVPLIIKRDYIIELGMLDENYFFGLEDTDLCCTISKEGHTIENAINAHHYRGMSTILLFSDNRDIFKALFSYNVLDKNLVRSIQQQCLNKAEKNGLEVQLTTYMKYFLNKLSSSLLQSEVAANYETLKLLDHQQRENQHMETLTSENIMRCIDKYNLKSSLQQILNHCKNEIDSAQ